MAAEMKQLRLNRILIFPPILRLDALASPFYPDLKR